MPELRDTNYYADQVALRYPLLDPKAVRRVCRYAMRLVGTWARGGEDVLLHSARYGIRLKIYVPNPSPRQHNAVNEAGARRRAAWRESHEYWGGTGPRSRSGKFKLTVIR